MYLDVKATCSGGWGEQAMANTHTHSVPRDTQGGWSLGG